MSLLKKIRQKFLNPVLVQNDEMKNLMAQNSKKAKSSFTDISNNLDDIKLMVNNFNYSLSQITEEQEEKNLKTKISTKWQIYDKVDDERFNDYHFKCKICDCNINTKTAKIYMSECIFHGGKLKSFECPKCDTIIGPLKMITLLKVDLDEDYANHYNIFQEGDTTEDEKFTFYKLKPSKEKTYLNMVVVVIGHELSMSFEMKVIKYMVMNLMLVILQPLI